MPLPTELPDADRFRNMNRAMALVLLEECYDRVVSPGATLTSKMELLKLNVKLGDMEPKQSILPSGTGFSVQIILSGGPSAAPINAEKVVESVPEYLSKADKPATIAIINAFSGLQPAALS